MKFKSKLPMSSRNYTHLHRTPSSVCMMTMNSQSVMNLMGEQRARESRNPTGTSEPDTIANSEAAKCGELFPVRPLVRPRVRFKNASGGDLWNDDCSKQYRFHPSHTPGLFTIQCVCARPKLLGITVMSESEGIATALSSLITRFPNLPGTTFYDNACNFVRSIRLRLLWVLDETDVLTDRFHYRSHRCCSLFDPDTFPNCDKLLTSGAEALSKRIATSRNHIRYLSGPNLIPLLYARSLFINIRARVREFVEDDDIEDVDVYEILQKYAELLLNSRMIQLASIEFSKDCKILLANFKRS